MARKTLQLDDFLHYQLLSGLVYAPGGGHAVLLATACNKAQNAYTKTLYLYSAESGNFAPLCPYTGTSWAFDGKDHIVIAQNTDETTIFNRLSLQDKTEKYLCTLPYKIAAFEVMANGDFAIIVPEDANRPISWPNQPSHLLAQPGTCHGALHQDYEVFEELPLRQNAAGYVSRLRRRLVLACPKTGQSQLITAANFDTESFCLSPDGASIVYLGRNFTELKQLHHSIAHYQPCTGVSTYILPQQKQMFAAFFACDASGVSYTATDMAQYGFGQIKLPYHYCFNTGNTQLLAEYDLIVGASEIVTDTRIGTFSLFKLYKGELYFGTTQGYKTLLRKLDKDGNICDVLLVDGGVECFDIAQDKIAYIAMEGLRLPELYVCDLNGKNARRISGLNDEIYNTRTLCPPRHFNFTNDGVKLDGWVITPNNYTPGKKYPAILDIHGGPRLVYGEVFSHEMQYWANQGYFILYCNPRGGSGKGNVFTDIWGPKKLGIWDYEDIMAFCDACLEIYPDIDPARMGVVGGSYGGFMVNWIIGHTSRFAAAASLRGISNWFSNTLTSDNGYFDWDRFAKTDIWTEHEELYKISPIAYAQKATTPTLFLHAFEDYRCPFEESLQMFTALKMNGVPTRMCAFKNENHEMSRSGKPTNRIVRMKEITGWFNKYLKEETEHA